MLVIDHRRLNDQGPETRYFFRFGNEVWPEGYFPTFMPAVIYSCCLLGFCILRDTNIYITQCDYNLNLADISDFCIDIISVYFFPYLFMLSLTMSLNRTLFYQLK